MQEETKRLISEAGYTIEVGFVDTYDNKFDSTTINCRTKEEAHEFMQLLSILKESKFLSDDVRTLLIVDWYERSTVWFKEEDKFEKTQEDYLEEVISIIDYELCDYFYLDSESIQIEWAYLTYTPEPIYVDLIDTI